MQDEPQIKERSGLGDLPASALQAFEPPPSRDPRPRYLFIAGDFAYTHSAQFPTGGLWVDSACVTNTICLRCDITPVLLKATRAQVEYIPEGMGIPGTQTEAGLGPIRLALQQYYDYPGPVVTNLLKNYQDRGLVEFDHLCGFNPGTVLSMKLRQNFFPDWPDLPENNSEIIENLERWLQIYGAIENVEDSIRTLILRTGEVMLRSAQVYNEWMQAIIDETHGRFTLGSEDRDRKRRYDRLDMLAMKRTGTARRDNELNQAAKSSNDLLRVLKEALLGASAAKSDTEPLGLTFEQLQAVMREQTDRIVAAVADEPHPPHGKKPADKPADKKAE